MTVTRLRPAHSAGRLAELYATPHDHTKWTDHRERVNATVALALPFGPWQSGADLSCGDGAILNALQIHGDRYLGDYARGYQFTGPISETIHFIPAVDVFVCTETLEHVDDPAGTLKLIREHTEDTLILSTPVNAWDDPNEEHYWAWSESDVEAMLFDAGFADIAYKCLPFRQQNGNRFYDFGIWVAVAA